MILLLFVATMMILNSFVYAEPIGGQMQPGEVYQSNEQRIAEAMNNPSLSAAEKARIAEKLNPKIPLIPRVQSTIDLVMDYCNQKSEYYCGLATVYHTLRFIL